MHTAEGRAHLASNAKPMWMQLPEGALKMQLLSEIADLVQLTNRELTDLWIPPAAPAKTVKDTAWRKNKDGESTAGASRYGQRNSYQRQEPRTRVGGRAAPASRADHAARIVLSHTDLWEGLSSEDHTMLCELEAPHGPLFVWVEGQLHEHGPLPWESLREELQGHESEDLVLRLMSDATVPAQPSEESGPELRDLLNRMLIDRIKEQETQAIDASKADPSAIDRYRELQTRRRLLEQTLIQTS